MLSYPHLDAVAEPELLLQQAASLTDEISRLRRSSTELTDSTRDRLWELKIQWMYAVFRAEVLTALRSFRRKSLRKALQRPVAAHPGRANP